MSIQRYSHHGNSWAWMEECDAGEYVKWDDIAHLIGEKTSKDIEREWNKLANAAEKRLKEREIIQEGDTSFCSICNSSMYLKGWINKKLVCRNEYCENGIYK